MRGFQPYLLLWLCAILMPASLFAQSPSIELKDAESTYIIGKQTEIFAVPKGEAYGIDAVSSPSFDGKFRASEQLFPNFGYVGQVWARFHVRNNSQQSSWHLNLDVGYVDSLSLYQQMPDGSWKAMHTGWAFPFDSRGDVKSGYFAFPLNLSPQEGATYYLRAHSQFGLALPMTIMPKATAQAQAQDWHMWYGIYTGILFIMMLYNLFLYIAMRNINYLYYAFSVLATLFTFVAISGYTFKYLFPNHPELNAPLLRISLTSIVVTTSLFASQFLKLRRYGKYLFYAMVANSAFAVIVLLGHSIFQNPYLNNITIRIQAPLLLISGVWCWKQGNKSARFFVLAWVFYIIGGIIISMRNAGSLPFNFWTSHGADIGSALEVALISLALADSYRLIKREKEEANQQMLEMEKEAKSTLEEKVKERTHQLNESNEELKQLNEEMQVTLERVQDQNEEIAKKNREITSSINYAQRIQQAILPPAEVLQEKLPEHFVLFLPCQVVSGDFYFFIEKGELLYLAAVDCTGHGVPGALMSMVGYNLLREIILDPNPYEPGEILHKLHYSVSSSLRQRDTGNHDGMDIGLCLIDRKQNLLKFAGAKSNLVYIQNQEAHAIKGSRNSIGGQYFHEKYSFETHSMPLDSATAFYLYSDGYPDQFGGVYDRKIGHKSFRELLASIAYLPFSEQKERLQAKLDSWKEKGNNKQTDDILVIGFHA